MMPPSSIRRSIESPVGVMTNEGFCCSSPQVIGWRHESCLYYCSVCKLGVLSLQNSGNIALVAV